MEKYQNGYISLNDEICVQKNLNLGEMFVVCNGSIKGMNPNEIGLNRANLEQHTTCSRVGEYASILKSDG